MSLFGSNENQNELLLYFLVLKTHINWLECGNVGNNTNIIKLWKKKETPHCYSSTYRLFYLIQT